MTAASSITKTGASEPCEKKLSAYESYMAWFTADSATAVGLALRTLAISLVAFTISQSTVLAGWLGTGALAVQQVLGIFGGTFTDRHERKTLVIVNAFAGTLLWGTVAILLVTGNLSFAVLTTLTLIACAINGFLGSAADAMLRSIVPISAYPKARSLNEGRDATINMMSNPLSGLLYGLFIWLPFAASALAYAVAGVAALGLRKDVPQRKVTSQCKAATVADEAQRLAGTDQSAQESNSFKEFVADFKEGWVWSFSKRTVLVVLTAASLLNFGVNGIQYAIQLHLIATGTPAMSIGLIGGAISFMMLVGSCIAARISNRISAGMATCVSFAFIALAALALPLLDSYWYMLVFNALLGLPVPLVNAMMLGFIFAKAPQHMQGRITVTLTVPAQILSMFCSAIAGMLLAATGFTFALAAFASVTLCAAILTLCSKNIRAIPCAQQWPDAHI
ncbi:MFS transporter [Bifidobacterium dolichotidis]|uniref:MFS transporter n=1 Tax=Bifidobacterium dolichotidis TaxID=2306976 RepID=A0A430FQT8_9BIFI|nr:MFS transporter [Bifidobacterium dolichotidis]RSX55209.1 MFS transporter [Bifidobacterium dolichotidis]